MSPKTSSPAPVPALPKITVVTPSYNQAAYIRETMESVLGQDYPALEYFVVDGGSTDGSVEIIKEYAPRLQWWVSEKDRGQSHAINKGFERATGELLCWVNSDDVLFPGCLHQIARQYLEHGRPDLIHCNFVYFDSEGKIIKVVDIPRQSAFFLLRGVWSAAAPAVFFRADLLKKVGMLDEQYYLSMDVDIWLRMIQAGGRVHYIDGYLGGLRWHASAKTSQSLKTGGNTENDRLFDAKLPGTTRASRRFWKILWKLYRIVQLDYAKSLLKTLRLKGRSWREAFGNKSAGAAG